VSHRLVLKTEDDGPLGRLTVRVRPTDLVIFLVFVGSPALSEVIDERLRAVYRQCVLRRSSATGVRTQWQLRNGIF
jgi:hypothetical protein